MIPANWSMACFCIKNNLRLIGFHLHQEYSKCVQWLDTSTQYDEYRLYWPEYRSYFDYLLCHIEEMKDLYVCLSPFTATCLRIYPLGSGADYERSYELADSILKGLKYLFPFKTNSQFFYSYIEAITTIIACDAHQFSFNFIFAHPSHNAQKAFPSKVIYPVNSLEHLIMVNLQNLGRLLTEHSQQIARRSCFQAMKKPEWIKVGFIDAINGVLESLDCLFEIVSERDNPELILDLDEEDILN